MAEIHRLIEQELAAGALGVSLGLGYAPDCFYSTKALIEALQPLKNSGIPITVHMRQEGSGVVDALREMITVAKALHTPVEVSHLKSIGKANWHRCTPEMLRLMHAPGLAIQRLTTKEPADEMIEVAIASMKPVLPENAEDAKW